MSTANTESGASNPTPAAAPSPLTVGKHFVKQYYQVLQVNTAQIHRFYQPSSSLSHAEGSDATDPSTLENYDIAGRWGIIGTETKGFNMDIGAIDAQTSIDNSILLVVTGSVRSCPKEPRKTFVHTFFLTYIPNTKRYYVANDVLRFLGQPSGNAVAEEGKVEEEEAVIPVKESPVVETPPPAPVAVEEIPLVEEAEEISPGGGVEEMKEEAPEDELPVEMEVMDTAPVEEPKAEVVEASKAATGKEGGNKGRRGKGGKAPQQPASKPAPGSWASLVASRPAVSAPLPPSPSRPSLVEEKEEAAEKPPVPVLKEKEPTHDDNAGQRQKRDPSCTLVIKNLSDSTKKPELIALFEGFASSSGGKILGATVSAHKGLGFVDFDSVPPVMAAIAKHNESPLELHGRVLEVDQKTAEQRSRQNKGGGMPGNGGAYRGSGGRNQFRRDNKGRGERGGRGRGGK